MGKESNIVFFSDNKVQGALFFKTIIRLKLPILDAEYLQERGLQGMFAKFTPLNIKPNSFMSCAQHTISKTVPYPKGSTQGQPVNTLHAR